MEENIKVSLKGYKMIRTLVTKKAKYSKDKMDRVIHEYELEETKRYKYDPKKEVTLDYNPKNGRPPVLSLEEKISIDNFSKRNGNLKACDKYGISMSILYRIRHELKVKRKEIHA